MVSQPDAEPSDGQCLKQIESLATCEAKEDLDSCVLWLKNESVRLPLSQLSIPVVFFAHGSVMNHLSTNLPIASANPLPAEGAILVPWQLSTVEASPLLFYSSAHEQF